MFNGDWDIRGPGLDGLFSGHQLSDLAWTAVAWTDEMCSPQFPGWELYRTIVSGDTIHMRKLVAYAIGMGRALTRAKRKTGHSEVARRARANKWIVAASLDALHIVIYGKPVAGIVEQARANGCSNAVYHRVRNAIAEGMAAGLEVYRSTLHANVLRVRAADADI